MEDAFPTRMAEPMNAGEQRRKCQYHMADEHVSRESNGQREPAQPRGGLLEGTHDGNHDQPGRLLLNDLVCTPRPWQCPQKMK